MRKGSNTVIAALVLLLVALTLPTTTEGACGGTSPNLTAASAARNDVNDCLTAAVNGDTITVPTGSATWTTTVATSKYVKILASGTVTITNNSSAGEGASLIALTESTAGSTRLQGFTFVQGTGVHGGQSAIVEMIFASGGKPILVTGNIFNLTNAGSGNSIAATTNRGVIWANTFTGYPNGVPSQCFNNTSALRHKPGGGSNWFSAANFGNTDTNGDTNLYFENNTILDALEAVDADDGARTVMRFNTFTNVGTLTHGDTSFPGGRYLDAYKNTFARDTSDKNCGAGVYTNVNGWANWRAGTGHWLDNTLPNLDSGLWGTKTEIRFSADGLTRNGGPCACYSGTYPFPAQTGWGYTAGGTAPGSACAGTIFQDLQPIYFAGNTGAFSVGSGDYGECGSQSVSTYVQANREYYSQSSGIQTTASSPFNGTVGTGYGTLANRPTTCTAGSTSAAGVGYWATDQGSWNTSGTSGGGQTQQGLFYRCTATNTWTLVYTPYNYPHPLAGGSGGGAPSNLTISGGVTLSGGVTIQ